MFFITLRLFKKCFDFALNPRVFCEQRLRITMTPPRPCLHLAVAAHHKILRVRVSVVSNLHPRHCNHLLNQTDTHVSALTPHFIFFVFLYKSWNIKKFKKKRFNNLQPIQKICRKMYKYQKIKKHKMQNKCNHDHLQKKSDTCMWKITTPMHSFQINKYMNIQTTKPI